jgi:hypothetical protein
MKFSSRDAANFDPRNPGYKINNAGWEAPLLAKTVAPEAIHFNNSLHYDLHNLYGTFPSRKIIELIWQATVNPS